MAALIEAIDVKRKMFFEFENAPYHCLEVEVSKPTARGGQTLVRLKMRNLLTSAVFDKTFKAAEKFDEPDLETGDASFMYADGDGFHFMDQSTFEQIAVPEGFREGKGPRLRQLYTTKEFPKDFILKLEFRAAVNADSGIFLRKPQLQCRDYLVAGPYKELKKYKAQDWNVIEVVVKDGVAHCTCNGEVLEAAFKLPPTGPIGLEADRGTMEYRRIQIKELP